jgi:hypothetical protein
MSTWAHKTLVPPSAVSHGCGGRFLGAEEAVVLAHGTWLELLSPQPSGALQSVAKQPVHANVRDLKACPRRALSAELAAQVGWPEAGSASPAAGPAAGGAPASHPRALLVAQVQSEDVLVLLTDTALVVWLEFCSVFNRCGLGPQTPPGCPALPCRAGPTSLHAVQPGIAPVAHVPSLAVAGSSPWPRCSCPCKARAPASTCQHLPQLPPPAAPLPPCPHPQPLRCRPSPHRPSPPPLAAGCELRSLGASLAVSEDGSALAVAAHHANVALYSTQDATGGSPAPPVIYKLGTSRGPAGGSVQLCTIWSMAFLQPTPEDEASGIAQLAVLSRRCARLLPAALLLRALLRRPQSSRRC